MANGSLKRNSTFKLVWENPNPTAEFAAQTVSVDLSDYDAVIISAATNGDVFGTLLIMKGGGGNFRYPSRPSTSPYNPIFYARQINSVTNSGVSFGKGQIRVMNSTTNTDDNSALIPQVIIGVKF